MYTVLQYSQGNVVRYTADTARTAQHIMCDRTHMSIGQQPHGLTHLACCWVECGKQLVFSQHTRSCEGVEQRGLAAAAEGAAAGAAGKHPKG